MREVLGCCEAWVHMRMHVTGCSQQHLLLHVML